MPTGSETTTRGDRTRAALLAVATEHLAEHGLDGLRGARVAAEAGVSEATVWFHLGTKQGLLVAVMERYYEQLVLDLAAVVDGESAPRDRLGAFARAWLRRISDDLGLVGEFTRHGRFGRDEQVRTSFARCNRSVTRLFERLVEDLAAAGVVRDDVAPRTVRDTFFGTAEHVLVGRELTGRPTDLDGAADALLDLLFRGVAGPAAAVAAAGRAGSGTPTLASIDAKLDRLLGDGPQAG